MNWQILCRLLGMLSLLIGASMSLSLPWAFPICGVATEFESRGFFGILAAITACGILGGLLRILGGKAQGTILQKEALAVVGIGWILAGVLGALPYLFSQTQRSVGVPMTFLDAFFESVSGFTTTGASVLTELEDPAILPKCVMFWRCFTHWLGGMGIIVLFVALLGQLGGGGKALMQREVPGPLTETVKPRVRETALAMWKIYVGLTGILCVVFALEGMTVFDSLCHTFGTMATGGFSTYNRSAGHFESVIIEMTMVFFMILAGTNFTLFYLLVNPPRGGLQQNWKRRFQVMLGDVEWRAYLITIGLVTLALFINLVVTQHYPSVLTAARHALFTTVSIMTTTGFGTENFSEWSDFSRGLLLLLMFVGGCAGSTAGGVKIIRFLLFAKTIRIEIEKSYRPNVIRSLRIGKEALPERLRYEVVVYFSLILTLFVVSWLLLNTIEPDTLWANSTGSVKAEKLIDCASAVAATMNNIGPGLGVLGPASNFSGFSQQGKLLLTLLMLLGRLELFAILVLFFPSFWRNQ
ncbi:MAG: TrkH family potassium uptake protein [Planctomycetaceae bacterium]|nr:TrkH family potassium uptake protein [Planctomycetaceae bacterium]